MTTSRPTRSTRTGALRRASLVGFALLIAAILFPGEAAACPVCYGGAEGDVIEGAKLSVFFMGGLVYTVMLGGVVMVVAARRRARREHEADAATRLRIVGDDDSTDRPRGED